jgi:MerR family transcriptional regulator, heat shock protein HspR
MASARGRATPGPRARQRSSSTVTRVEVEADRGVFMISVAAELASMHPQTLRMYEARGLIEPQRSAKGTRLYSHRDVERLRRIQAMTADLGLNLAGVERVLELESQLAELHSRVEELELQALQAKVRLAKELEELRRSFRAELVPYQGRTDVVRAVDVSPPFGLTVRPDRARTGGGRSERRGSNGS